MVLEHALGGNIKKHPAGHIGQRGADETELLVPQGRNLGGDYVHDLGGNHSTALLGGVTLHKGVLDSSVTRIVTNIVKSIEFNLEVTLDDEVLIVPLNINGHEVFLLILVTRLFEVVIVSPVGVSKILDMLAVVESDTDGITTSLILEAFDEAESLCTLLIAASIGSTGRVVTKDATVASPSSSDSNPVAFAI